MKKELTTVALAGAVLGGVAITSQTAMAKEVNCKGVATKWVNDCQANGHECAMKAIKNFDNEEWLKMDEKDCKAVKSALKSAALKRYIEKIQKGTVVATKRGKKF